MKRLVEPSRSAARSNVSDSLFTTSSVENKLLIRHSKGHKDRVLPLPTSMYEELRRYWDFHRHPLLIFPNAGRGDNNSPKSPARRMHAACTPPSHEPRATSLTTDN